MTESKSRLERQSQKCPHCQEGWQHPSAERPGRLVCNICGRYDGSELPKALYVWLVPSEEMLDQPGSWRIRKWDTAPFPEATHVCASVGACQSGPCEWTPSGCLNRLRGICKGVDTSSTVVALEAFASSPIVHGGWNQPDAPTPRTDAESFWTPCIDDSSRGMEVVPASLARVMERDLDDARKSVLASALSEIEPRVDKSSTRNIAEEIIEGLKEAKASLSAGDKNA